MAQWDGSTSSVDETYSKGSSAPALKYEEHTSDSYKKAKIIPIFSRQQGEDSNLDDSGEAITGPIYPYTRLKGIHDATTGEQQPSNQYTEIIRTFYMERIFDSLEKLPPFANSPSAANFINDILHAIKEMEEKNPTDPILDVLFAFYDALAYDNNWANYKNEDYVRAKNELEKLYNLSVIHDRDIEKSIVNLQEIGFDTIPFEMILDDI